MLRKALLPLVLASTPVLAEYNSDTTFIEANIISIFYHELAHALVDLEQVPIFGQEEDAADVFSIFLIDALYEPKSALSLAYDASYGFLGEAYLREEEGMDISYWDTHGPDEQRFYNTACLFYGADPDNRAEFAADMELPEERLDFCPEEYEQAANSWGLILDEIWSEKPENTIYLVESPDDEDSLIRQTLKAEIDDLSQNLNLSQPLPVAIKACDEANAFYNPEDQSITFCEEFEPHLYKLLDRLQ